MTRILGIDLGTTNSAFATASDDAPARALPIAQLIGPGEIAERPTLPSFLLLPNELERWAGTDMLASELNGPVGTARNVESRNGNGRNGRVIAT